MHDMSAILWRLLQLLLQLARDIYSAQYRSVKQNWQASSPLHFHFSDNAYVVALFRNIPSRRYKISLSLEETKVDLETAGGQLLFHLGYNACKGIGCSKTISAACHDLRIGVEEPQFA